MVEEFLAEDAGCNDNNLALITEPLMEAYYAMKLIDNPVLRIQTITDIEWLN